MSEILARGRDAFARQRWADAAADLAEAGRAAPLGVDDLERLAVAHFLTGADDASVEAWTRAHHACVELGDPARAARCAFWLAFGLDITGSEAQAAGWNERARRLADEVDGGCVEQGYARVPGALATLMVVGDAEAARAEFAAVTALADSHGDPDLATLGRLGWGHALVLAGERGAGIAMLDEVMVTVTAGEVSPVLAGLAYCAVIEVCQDTFDLRRAREWTDALSTWCAAQPDLEPFRGNCLVHRAEIMQLDGAWSEALLEAQRAVEALSRPAGGGPGVGEACYRRGELHRLRGDVADAEDAFRQASHWGREPQPGLALLRLGQGRLGAARAAIRRATAEATGDLARARLLPAQVEIALAAGDLDTARRASTELAAIAADQGAPLLLAAADHAGGAVLLAAGEPQAALGPLRTAQDRWRRVGAPYEAARTRELAGLACRAVGDDDGASLELEGAATAYARLGAAPDADRVAGVDAAVTAATGQGPDDAATLSRREREVLAAVATGRTNRQIAADLHISEKTVARHLSNIFAKIDVSTRAGATAYAYDHGLATPLYTE